ncbi:MAG: Crp/Fnr family transcriptional regulator [Hyphomonadaceae bacterium]|nr:Crp/Fnr family transcriptional regulator [Hyphomonadaceae bacterium]
MNPGLEEADFDVRALVVAVRQMAERDRVWSSERRPKGSVLLVQGDTSSSVFVLESGLVKLCYETSDGDEWVKSFIPDVGLFGSRWPLSTSQENRFSARCLEWSQIATLPADWVRSKIAADSQLQATVARFSEWIYRRKQSREETLLCETAERRYLSFLTNNASLAKRLSQADIARYLGVTPIAFSRIKERVRQKNLT